MKQGMSGEEALAKVNTDGASSTRPSNEGDEEDDDEDYLDEDSDLDEDELTWEESLLFEQRKSSSNKDRPKTMKW